MKESMTFDVEHELNGATVYDPSTLRVVATNIIVREDGSTVSVGTGNVSGDVSVFHGNSVEYMAETIEEKGWLTRDTHDFIQQTHELTEAVNNGEFDDVYFQN